MGINPLGNTCGRVEKNTAQFRVYSVHGLTVHNTRRDTQNNLE